MSGFHALNRYRIGCVRYLNARPLIHAYRGPVLFEHPSVLAQLLAAGHLDLALIPIFEVIRTPSYRVVDGVAIAAQGPVYSVFLTYTGELDQLRIVQCDPASLTSVNLLDVLLREFYGSQPLLEKSGEPEAPPKEGMGRLLIGNQAIEFRKKHGDRFRYLDLGEAWSEQTGLPFVFAAWALRPGTSPEAADALRQLKSASLAQLEEIISNEPDPAFARDYLTTKIRFDLGPEEKHGIARFASLLGKHRPAVPEPGIHYI